MHIDHLAKDLHIFYSHIKSCNIMVGKNHTLDIFTNIHREIWMKVPIPLTKSSIL